MFVARLPVALFQFVFQKQLTLFEDTVMSDDCKLYKVNLPENIQFVPTFGMVGGMMIPLSSETYCEAIDRREWEEKIFLLVDGCNEFLFFLSSNNVDREVYFTNKLGRLFHITASSSVSEMLEASVFEDLLEGKGMSLIPDYVQLDGLGRECIHADTPATRYEFIRSMLLALMCYRGKIEMEFVFHLELPSIWITLEEVEQVDFPEYEYAKKFLKSMP